MLTFTYPTANSISCESRQVYRPIITLDAAVSPVSVFVLDVHDATGIGVPPDSNRITIAFVNALPDGDTDRF